MKHRFKTILTLTLSLALSVSIMTPAFAAEGVGAKSESTSPVILNIQPIVFDVAVPTGLPVDVNAQGEVTVANNAKKPLRSAYRNCRSTGESFNSSKATSMDLSSFDTSKVTTTTNMFTSSRATIGYAHTQADANKFNASSERPSTLIFVVK